MLSVYQKKTFASSFSDCPGTFAVLESVYRSRIIWTHQIIVIIIAIEMPELRFLPAWKDNSNQPLANDINAQALTNIKANYG